MDVVMDMVTPAVTVVTRCLGIIKILEVKNVIYFKLRPKGKALRPNDEPINKLKLIKTTEYSN